MSAPSSTDPAERSSPPRRRAGAGALSAALVPVVTCVTALLLLTAYTSTGAAGDAPARISVSNARIFVPPNSENTAAFFDISNTGATGDVLTSVSSPRLGGVMLGRRVTKDGAGHMEPLDSLPIPARGRVQMTPYGVDVMVEDPPELKAGDKVRFDLRFRDSGQVTVEAVTVPVRS
ncbi:copper chaperone PCu(A)C [Streptomyces sp. NBC_00083]|uniref:copper chaperone PCu(A)C n=1 Tax=Streptomyces sp. NBC_00083 TaxID=2975647 RepID=UPI002254CD5E|nr:copper chaperone PCu(A)C [Streptomyces sp. NBC_00083]MCX5384673.1 copper chaperone PCu(A)C [Streptomyces sp. NBC_00083]